jgi:hypothetical protein
MSTAWRRSPRWLPARSGSWRATPTAIMTAIAPMTMRAMPRPTKPRAGEHVEGAGSSADLLPEPPPLRRREYGRP